MEQSKMTSGAILGRILRFTGPIILGQLLQQLYNIVDTAIVGSLKFICGQILPC